MSTESTVDYTVALPKGSQTAAAGVGSVGRGGFAAPLEESPSCSILWLSKHTEFALFFFFSLFACTASNSLLIVYTAFAAQHNKVTLSSSPLPSSFPVFPVPLCCFPRLRSSSSTSSSFLLLLWRAGWGPGGSLDVALQHRRHSATFVPRSCWAAILYFMSRRSAPSIHMTPI